MGVWRLLLFILVLCGSGALAQSLRLSAAAGHFNPKTLSGPSDAVAVAGTLRLLAFDGTSAWPTAAYMGVYEGPNRNNSVQILAIRNRMSDDYLVVGYRLVVDGKEVKVASLQNVPLSSEVRVSVQFKKGAVSMRVNGRPPIELRTPFNSVAPYVSVSSGEAEFSIDP